MAVLNDKQQDRMLNLYKGYMADAAFRSQQSQIEHKRMASVQGLREIVEQFIAGDTSLSNFVTAANSYAARHKEWALGGPSGLMVASALNRLVASDPTLLERATEVLRMVLQVPDNIAEVRNQIEQLTSFADKLFINNKPSLLKNFPFVLSLFWNVQSSGRWPVFFFSSSHALKRLGFANDTDSPAENYVQFYRVVQELGMLHTTHPQDIRDFLFWISLSSFPGFDPADFSGLANNASLNAIFAGNDGYPDGDTAARAEEHARTAYARLKELGQALRPELSYESYELGLKIRPSEARAVHGEPIRWRQEMWLSVWQPERQARFAVSKSPQLQVRINGSGLFVGYYSGQLAGLSPAQQLAEGEIARQLAATLARADEQLYTIAADQPPQPVSRDEVGSQPFFVGVHYAPDNPALYSPEVVSRIAATLRSLFPLYESALVAANTRQLAVPEEDVLIEPDEAEGDDALTYTPAEPNGTHIAEAATIYQPVVLVTPQEYVPPSFAEVWQRVSGVLAIDEDTVRAVYTHLLAGRHLLLAGPPGVGKTRLARLLAEAFCGAGNYTTATANPEWSVYEVVGGLRPRVAESRLAYEFAPGIVSRAAHACAESVFATGAPHYLIVDEFNRANLDRAFGELFTALEYPDVPLLTREGGAPYDLSIPPQFRLIGTLNSDDRNSLFDVGFALRRRFALVEVGLPDPTAERAILPTAVAENLRRRAATPLPASPARGEELMDDNNLRAAMLPLQSFVAVVREVRAIGTALLIDVLAYCVTAVRSGAYAESVAALQDAIIANIVPQLERHPAAVDYVLAQMDTAALPAVAAALQRLRDEEASLLG